MTNQNIVEENASEVEPKCDKEIHALQESAKNIVDTEKIFWKESALANETFWDFVQRIHALRRKKTEEK